MYAMAFFFDPPFLTAFISLMTFAPHPNAHTSVLYEGFAQLLQFQTLEVYISRALIMLLILRVLILGPLVDVEVLIQSIDSTTNDKEHDIVLWIAHRCSMIRNPRLLPSLRR